MVIVSLPFLIGAFRGKISWRFFISWTLTSVFATLTIFFLKRTMEKNLDEKQKLITSIILGIVFMAIGAYLRTIRSYNLKVIGLMFIAFGVLWIALSF